MERNVNILRIVIILIALPLLLVSVSGLVEAAGGGLEIPNIPPTFKSVNVDLQKDLHLIEIVAFDTNGAWGPYGDIYKVTVRIYDQSERVLAAYMFQQYDSTNGSDSINEFSEIEGTSGILITPQCTFSHPIADASMGIGEQQLIGSQLNITFASLAIDGYRIEITLEDREGSYSTVENPYYKSSASFSKNGAVVAILLSSLGAGAFSLYTMKPGGV